MGDELLKAILDSDGEAALEALAFWMEQGDDPWAIHEELFPVAQRVLNPPFINPHYPKMYRIVRELAAYLEPDDLPGLLRLEVSEYARQPKLDLIPRTQTGLTSLEAFQEAIRAKDVAAAAAHMGAFHRAFGAVELARRLLLLGSGYLEGSLGHSVSCTGFIVQEMIHQESQDPWPTLAFLADYFCKGGFSEMVELRPDGAPPDEETLAAQMVRAVSGRGIVNLHHTITLYGIERVRHLVNDEPRLAEEMRSDRFGVEDSSVQT